MRKFWTITSAGILLFTGVLIFAADRYEGRQYRRYCIESLTDQGRCNRGPAVEPRKKCSRMEWPPGASSEGKGYGSECVKAWLAYRK
jgi:hypothetical protein